MRHTHAHTGATALMVVQVGVFFRDSEGLVRNSTITGSLLANVKVPPSLATGSQQCTEWCAGTVGRSLGDGGF